MQNRKDFLKSVSLITFGSILAKDVVFAKNISPEMARLMQEGNDLASLGKSSKLSILNNRPWNVETPAHLLDDEITPADKLFIRNNGIPPADINEDEWLLEIDGESVEKKSQPQPG